MFCLKKIHKKRKHDILLLNPTTEREINMLNKLFGKKKLTTEQMESRMFSMFEKTNRLYEIKVIDSKEQLVEFTSLYIKKDLGSDIKLIADFQNKTIYDDEGPYMYEEQSVLNLAKIKREIENVATLLEFKCGKTSLDEVLGVKKREGIVYK